MFEEVNYTTPDHTMQEIVTVVDADGRAISIGFLICDVLYVSNGNMLVSDSSDYLQDGGSSYIDNQ